MTRTFLSLLAGLLFGLLLWNAAIGLFLPTVPPCQEDQVIVGSGSFEHGYWSTYQCQNLDALEYQSPGRVRGGSW